MDCFGCCGAGILFALGIHDDIARIKAKIDAEMPGALDWTAWYLDDGAIAGSLAAAHAFYARVQVALAALRLNLDVLRGGASTLTAESASRIPPHSEATVRETCR